MRGKIITYYEEKGYGFILGEDACKYFFHISNTKEPLDIKKGIFVHFDKTTGKNAKPAAKNVSIEKNHTTQKNNTQNNNTQKKIVIDDEVIFLKYIVSYKLISEEAYGSKKCRYCEGQGSEECYYCEGQGYKQCSCCSGFGDEDCYTCQGRGNVDCPYCDGNEEDNCSYCCGVGYVRCPECNGEASYICSCCNGSGEDECTYCDGQGYNECTFCDGRGYIDDEPLNYYDYGIHIKFNNGKSKIFWVSQSEEYEDEFDNSAYVEAEKIIRKLDELT